jgi:hypothetical protein
VEILENVYETITESKMMYSIEVCGSEVVWTEIGKVHARFCKKLKQVAKSGENGMAELELGRNSGRGKVLCMIVKCCIRIMQEQGFRK